MFYRRNVKMAHAPQCWLFDDAEQGSHTEGRALQIRQVIAVMEFMSSLAISNERKATVLNQNREWLGEDIFAYLTRRSHLKRSDRCIFMWTVKFVASNLLNQTLVKANKCLHVLRSFRKEEYSQVERDHLLKSLVLSNFRYCLSVSGASEPDLN